jgi:hypothetical protein
VKLSTRITAALVALSAWTGLLLQFYDSARTLHSPLSALWVMALYFTITTNVLVAVAFTATALEHVLHPRLVAAVLLAIELVGVVYHLLLRNVPIVGGPAAHVANVFLHTSTPLLVLFFWMACAPKGQLRWMDAILWPLYPLVYLAYALVRGQHTGVYPYPFIDVTKIGMAASLRNSAWITAAFLVVSLLLILADRAYGRKLSAITAAGRSSRADARG